MEREELDITSYSGLVREYRPGKRRDYVILIKNGNKSDPAIARIVLKTKDEDVAWDLYRSLQLSIHHVEGEEDK